MSAARIATEHRLPHRLLRSFSKGYEFVRVDGKLYRSSRGVWPARQIDHINGDSSDNRLGNLREATNQQNSQNQRGHNARSGKKGVHWDSALGDGKTKHVEEAKEAYNVAAKRYFGEFARE